MVIQPEHKRTGNRLGNIAAYVSAKEIRERAPAMITNGKLLVFHNGNWISNKAFLAVTVDPKSLLINPNYKGENCCKRVANIS